MSKRKLIDNTRLVPSDTEEITAVTEEEITEEVTEEYVDIPSEPYEGHKPHIITDAEVPDVCCNEDSVEYYVDLSRAVARPGPDDVLTLTEAVWSLLDCVEPGTVDSSIVNMNKILISTATNICDTINEILDQE